MSGPAKIWICAAFYPVYRCGGWAYVRVAEGQVNGVAGGERNTTASRTALAGLVASLRGLAPGVDVEIITTSSELTRFAGVLAGVGSPSQAAEPEDDLDLWAQIMTASAGRRLTLSHAPLKPGTPCAFAAAWADLGRDKAKASGAFSSAIPKPNLAKVQGLS